MDARKYMSGAHLLYSLGPETERVVKSYTTRPPRTDLTAIRGRVKKDKTRRYQIVTMIRVIYE